MGSFQFELGATVNVIGHFNGGAVIQRGTWESLARPEPVNYYVIRLGDKEITASEAEVSQSTDRQTDTA